MEERTRCYLIAALLGHKGCLMDRRDKDPDRIDALNDLEARIKRFLKRDEGATPLEHGDGELGAMGMGSEDLLRDMYATLGRRMLTEARALGLVLRDIWGNDRGYCDHCMSNEVYMKILVDNPDVDCQENLRYTETTFCRECYQMVREDGNDAAVLAVEHNEYIREVGGVEMIGNSDDTERSARYEAE